MSVDDQNDEKKATNLFADMFKSIGQSLSHTTTKDDIFLGDHLYVYRLIGIFSHHGIYCGYWKDIKVSVLNKIKTLNNAEHLDFFKRLKELNSIFIDNKDKQKQNSKSILSSMSTFNSINSQSIADILNAVTNKQRYLYSLCSAFQNNDQIIIHLSGDVNSGPIVSPTTLNAFVNDGVGACNYLNILKRVKYNCNYLEFKLKRSGSCSNQKMLTNRNVTIERAIDAIGWDEYSVTQFNCESFAVYCKLQQPISYQADKLLSINNIFNATVNTTKKLVNLMKDDNNDDDATIVKNNTKQ